MGKLINPASNPGALLRNLLSRQEPLMAPGAFDGLSARLIEEAGFDAVYMTGFGAAASVLGRPDVGLLTMTEMVEHARQISQAVSPLPVIADADTGYGNPISVIKDVRTGISVTLGPVERGVKAFDRAGIGSGNYHEVG